MTRNKCNQYSVYNSFTRNLDLVRWLLSTLAGPSPLCASKTVFLLSWLKYVYSSLSSLSPSLSRVFLQCYWSGSLRPLVSTPLLSYCYIPLTTLIQLCGDCYIILKHSFTARLVGCCHPIHKIISRYTHPSLIFPSSPVIRSFSSYIAPTICNNIILL